jgi:hypothetical protein
VNPKQMRRYPIAERVALLAFRRNCAIRQSWGRTLHVILGKVAGA